MLSQRDGRIDMTEEVMGYGKPLTLGHKWLDELWDGTVYIQEKIDGSQFSFTVTDDDVLLCRSHNQQIYTLEEASMFQPAVDMALVLQSKGVLTKGYIYRCEFLRKPKHNKLAYERTPEGFLILFDVDMGNQDYMRPKELKAEAQKIGLEVVPMLAKTVGGVPDLALLDGLLDKDSILGGCKIEGIVLKNYDKISLSDSKVLMGKYVSADFKEKMKQDKSVKKSTLERIIFQLKTDARWDKAIQHLEEQGELEREPRDIGKLVREIQEDTFEEEGEWIRDTLYESFKKDIERGIVGGFAEYYKRRLAEEAMSDGK
jgi:hypothetical protein